MGRRQGICNSNHIDGVLARTTLINKAIYMKLYTQSGWAAGLSVNFGSSVLTDWRLTTTFNQNCSGWDCANSELGDLWYTKLSNTKAGGFSNTGDFQNLSSGTSYWSSTDYTANTNHAWFFNVSNGTQSHQNKGLNTFGVAVMDGMAVVPEPVSSTLFLIGVATLGFRRFRIKYIK